MRGCQNSWRPHCVRICYSSRNTPHNQNVLHPPPCGRCNKKIAPMAQLFTLFFTTPPPPPPYIFYTPPQLKIPAKCLDNIERCTLQRVLLSNLYSGYTTSAGNGMNASHCTWSWRRSDRFWDGPCCNATRRLCGDVMYSCAKRLLHTVSRSKLNVVSCYPKACFVTCWSFT